MAYHVTYGARKGRTPICECAPIMTVVSACEYRTRREARAAANLINRKVLGAAAVVAAGECPTGNAVAKD